MLEAQTCSKCGGPLSEGLICPFCGTRYSDTDDKPSVVINITNNFNSEKAPVPELPVEESEVRQEEEQVEVKEEQPKPKKIAYEEKGLEAVPTVPGWKSKEAIVGYVGIGLGIISFISCNVILALIGVACCFISLKARGEENV